mgnify:CR=1 FL=1
MAHNLEIGEDGSVAFALRGAPAWHVLGGLVGRDSHFGLVLWVDEDASWRFDDAALYGVRVHDLHQLADSRITR